MQLSAHLHHRHSFFLRLGRSTYLARSRPSGTSNPPPLPSRAGRTRRENVATRAAAVRIVAIILRLPSSSFVPSLTLESGLPHLRRFLYFDSEQFWGRAVRASRDSLNPGRFLFGSNQRTAPLQDLHRFVASRQQTAIRGIQNDLVLPAFFPRNRERLRILQRSSETVHLARIGELV